MTNLVSAREFWERKVDLACKRFEYTGDRKEFTKTMTRLGYDAKELNAIVDNWMTESNNG